MLNSFWHKVFSVTESVLLLFTGTGKVSLSLVSQWKEPASNSSEDIAAADRAMNFELGWFANPIFINGDYPEVNRKITNNNMWNI